MRKTVLLYLLVSLISFAGYLCGEDREILEIRQGMHEKIVNEKYGQPVLTEELKSPFLTIPRKKALYKVDESDYMILYFFSGRVNRITLLEDTDLEEATAMFKEH